MTKQKNNSNNEFEDEKELDNKEEIELNPDTFDEIHDDGDDDIFEEDEGDGIYLKEKKKNDEDEEDELDIYSNDEPEERWKL